MRTASVWEESRRVRPFVPHQLFLDLDLLTEVLNSLPLGTR